MLRRTFVLLIALILCAIVWWIGPLIAIGPYFPLADVWVRGVIVGLILCWALWPFVALFFSWIFRHARAPLPAPKKAPQRDRVSARFYDALRTLQYVGLAAQKGVWQRWRYRFNRTHTNSKPWFLIMGPPESGKTSLIYESGESFLLSEQYGLARTVDVGPTQDCNWWLTERAVYIDTSGEWIQLHGQSEESSKARQTLFQLVRRHRRHPGIDGIILCLDAHWLLHASLTERKSMADTLRARILEAASWFRCDIPVYFTINKVDKLPGGEMFLSVLSDALLNKGIGLSMTKNMQGHNDFAVDSERYQNLIGNVSYHVLELLHDVHNVEIRQQLLFFTEALGALRNPLFNLFEQLFPVSVMGYAGRLQQLWFGSTQQLKPWGALYNQETSYMYDPRPAGQTYFINLGQAVSERGILQASGALPLRDRLYHLSRHAVVLVILGLMFGLLTVRYFWENDYISYVAARFDETKRISREIPVTNRASDDLVSAYEQLGYMNAQLLDNNGPIVNPYFEHRLMNQVAEQTYHRHLFKIFWPAVEHYINAELSQELGDLNADVYSTLKVYLMLGKPDRRSAADLENWFSARWSSFAPQGYTDNDRKLFGYHLHEIFSADQKEAPVTQLNDEIIRAARIKAMKIPMQIRVIRSIQSQPLPARIENITLADAAGSSVSMMLRRKSQATVTDVAIAGFYTRASYRDVFLPKLDRSSKDMIDEEAWVLGDGHDDGNTVTTMASAQKLADEARKLYLLEYADQWDGFLRDIGARPVSSLDDAALLARQLSDPSSPLANLVRFAAREVSITGNNQGDAGSWIDDQKNKLEQKKRYILGEISGERSRFRLTPEGAVEDRFVLLRRLGYQLLQPTNNNNDPLARTFEELYNQLSTLSSSLRAGQILPQNSAFSRLRIDAARQPEPVRSVMLDLLDTGGTQSVEQSRHNLSSGASAVGAGLCKGTIGGRYPFDRNAREEVGIGDFARMFGRNGAMQSFFDQNLTQYVDVNAKNWRVKEDGQNIISPSTLKSFENASLIRETFFPNGDQLAFSMLLRPISLSPNILEAVLDIDGQLVSYSHGYVQPMRLEWPGPKGGAYVRLTFKTDTGNVETVSFDGPWAVFHMYDASNPQIIDADRRELTMAMGSVAGQLKLELRSTMKDYPLWSPALSKFSCPDSI